MTEEQGVLKNDVYEADRPTTADRVHSGWSDDEERMLFLEARSARKTGRPLKNVFDLIAEATGRKPNSIRNYYYSKLKEASRERSGMEVSDEFSDICCQRFEPFTEEEVRSLMKTVLSAQAMGKSVRSCTLDMGGGSNKLMLRYQNKYRAVLKNDPELVYEIVSELQEEGLPRFDPYLPENRRMGRRKKTADENMPHEACRNCALRAYEALLDMVKGSKSV